LRVLLIEAGGRSAVEKDSSVPQILKFFVAPKMSFNPGYPLRSRGYSAHVMTTIFIPSHSYMQETRKNIGRVVGRFNMLLSCGAESSSLS